MRTATTEFRRTMAQRRNFVNYADMTLSNGTVLHLEPKDFRLGGNNIEDDIVDGDNFNVGTAIGKTVTIVLDNTDERFSLYDFYGAYFFLYVALPLPTELEPNRVEKIRIGKFTVITPATTGTLITIEAVDNMFLFDQPYEDSNLSYPATLGAIVEDACSMCGVNYTYSSTHFDGYNMVVQTRPEGDFTFRQIISYVAQIACCYAKINDQGALIFSWFEDVTPESNADGGNFSRAGEASTPYITGDDLDGGTFAYNDGDNYDGGRFTDVSNIINLGGSAKGVKVATDDIVITGVRVKNGKDTDILEGTDDYPIVVSDNPLTVGNESTIASILGTKLIGLTFRPFSLSYLQDPTIESGDWVIVEDIKRNTYKSFVTNIKFSTLGYMSISCNAQPPSKQASVYSSQAASAIVKQNRLTVEKISYYDIAVQRMNALAANAMGMYTYEKVDKTDGSRIYYLSNKPIEDHDGEPYFTIHSSLWKLTGDGFFLCQDAGQTDRECAWTNGWDTQGNVVVNSLSAIGISFDWARGGTLTLGGDNNINGVLSVLNAMGRERVRIDNTGIIVGDKVGSKIYVTTDGEIDYYYDNNYSGKLVMEAVNYGTESNPDLHDTMEIKDFDDLRISTSDDYSWIQLHNNNATGAYNGDGIKIESDGDVVIDGDITHIFSDDLTKINSANGKVCIDAPHGVVFGDLDGGSSTIYPNGFTGSGDAVAVPAANIRIVNGSTFEDWQVYNGMLCHVTNTGPYPYITYGTQDLTPGTTPLEEGHVYLVYE